VKRRPAPRIAWLGAAAILVVAALVALAAIARGDFSDTDGRILGSLGAVLYTGGALFAGLATVDRGRPTIGWSVVAGAPVCFVALLPAIWSFLDEGGNDDAWRWAWSAALALLVAIMLATAMLLARTHAAQLLALVSGAGAGIAATLSIAAIWADGADGWIKAIAILWILAVLAYVLVPVVDRFTRAGLPAGERVLAVLGDVELVATTAPGSVGIDPKLATGELLLLRRGHSASSRAETCVRR
jgi:hypothetical protein